MSDDTTRVKASELDRLEDRTDWKRVRSLSDDEIEQAVEEDPDQVLRAYVVAQQMKDED